MATNFGSVHVDELFVAGRRVSGDSGAPLLVARPAVPESEATTVKALVADFNALLGALRAAGILAEA